MISMAAAARVAWRMARGASRCVMVVVVVLLLLVVVWAPTHMTKRVTNLSAIHRMRLNTAALAAARFFAAFASLSSRTIEGRRPEPVRARARVCVCVCVCVRACVRVCERVRCAQLRVCARARAYVRAFVCLSVCVRAPGGCFSSTTATALDWPCAIAKDTRNETVKPMATA